MTDKSAIAHFYRKFRGNLERTAESAYQSARSHVHFLKRLDAMVRGGKKRSRAAKRGHRTRMTNAA